MFYKKILNCLLILFTILSGLGFLNINSKAQSIPVFSPNLVMSDDTFRSTRSFPTVSSVQNFLNQKNGPLKTYSQNGKSAAQIIFEAARGITSTKFGVTPSINPGVLLAYLEKEMSLISIRNYDSNLDPQGRLTIAMGYGCPDTAKCNVEYYGFSNQLNWAAYQLQANFNRSEAGSDAVLPYRKNNKFVTLDEYTVTPSNSATAANYRYTPHVYWGNYNLWKIIVANGWGQSTSTFSYAEIDAVNLAAKDQPVSNPQNPYGVISKVEGLNLVKQSFNFGQRSSSIGKLQAFLRQEGYYQAREINGMFGTITPAAQKRYRLQNKIIDWTFTTVSKERCQFLIKTNFTIGTTSTDVLDLQKCLSDIGVFDKNLQTSYYGSITDTARKSALAYLLELEKTTLPTGGTKPETPLNEGISAKLNKYTSSPLSALDCNFLQYQQYKIGRTGQRVYDLQRCLVLWKLLPANATTGYYGAQTNNARVRNVDTRNMYFCSQLIAESFSPSESGERVLQLQKCLTRAGIYDASLQTGLFGGYSSVKLQQAKDIISYSGCWDIMFTQEPGDNSSGVKNIQECLIKMGFLDAGNNTGFYGELTKSAIEKAKVFAFAIKV